MLPRSLRRPAPDRSDGWLAAGPIFHASRSEGRPCALSTASGWLRPLASPAGLLDRRVATPPARRQKGTVRGYKTRAADLPRDGKEWSDAVDVYAQIEQIFREADRPSSADCEVHQ